MARGTVVFDLDGTLADTSVDLIGAANAAFRNRGLPDLLDPVADVLIAFAGGRAMLRAGYGRMPADRLLPPDAEDADLLHLLAHYDTNIAAETHLYEGVEDALDRLSADGFALAICTNKPDALAEKLLAALGVRHRFDAMIGADTLPQRKPDARPYRAAVAGAGGTVARSFLVGDTITDRDTARAAGVRIAMIGFGPQAAAVARLQPDAVIDHFDALPALAADWLAPARLAGTAAAS